MSSAETLLAQAVAAFNAGDMRTAADRFERAASTLAAVRPGDAVLALESATRLRMMLDQPHHAQLAITKAATTMSHGDCRSVSTPSATPR